MASKFPTYRHHKASGRAYVQWKPLYGIKRHYLAGKHGSAESMAEYAAILASVTATPQARTVVVSPSLATVNALVDTFCLAKGYSKEAGYGKTNIKSAVKILKKKAGKTLISKFGPLALAELRTHMIAAGWCVSHINQVVGRVRYIFKCGVGYELVTAERYGALSLVEGLKPGETTAPVRPRIKPIAWEHAEAILAKLPPMLAAMVQIHGLSGMRSDELCSLTLAELDRSLDVWIYRRDQHKTAHLGKEKIICFGPRAQELMRPYMEHRGPFIFGPKIAEQERKDALAANRKTPLYGKAKTRVATFQAKRDRYDARTYSRTIKYAFVRLANERSLKPGEPKPKKMCRPEKGEGLREWLRVRGVTYWHPHQLRHSRGTDTRAAYGIEGAQAQLGNSLKATQIYAESSLALAMRIASETG